MEVARIGRSTRQAHTVIVLRPPVRGAHTHPYATLLQKLDVDALEQPSLEAARSAVAGGCRVGLLIVSDEGELRQLDACEPFLNLDHVAWVGLIADELTDRPRILELIGEHLFNFVRLSASPAHVELMIRHAWGMAHARAAHRYVGSLPPTTDTCGMVGRSEHMQRLFEQIRKVARTDASVMISGPSGTGKEMVARAIHRQSARADAPFVAVNCGAITPQLFQSELFGYEKGAFTGAHQRRIGRIEAAHGGTLFLDEIGDMPFDMQVNLLRFLQEKTIERVGGSETRRVDVRVIAATHVDLAQAVREGRFREDLYYRINVVCIAIPTLAERIQDVEDIARHYFALFAGQHNRSLRGFSRAAMEAMLRHTWPGNVRELVNRVQRATVMAEGRFIQPEDLGFERSGPLGQIVPLDDARAAAERATIERALAQSRYRISQAASLLGISRMKLYRLLEKYRIRAQAPLTPLPKQKQGTVVRIK